MKYKSTIVKILKWSGVIGVLLLLCGYLIPALIKGGFLVLLYMLKEPLISLIILVNLFMWQMVYIKYTDKKKNQLK
jgi:hypothetical protein